MARLTVLAITSQSDDCDALRNILRSDNWDVRGVPLCDAALDIISKTNPAVILCEQSLPDGTWRNLINSMDRLAPVPPVIVMSRQADEKLWAEVLNLGAYDLLQYPFEESEVRRVVGGAFRSNSSARALALC